MEKTKSFGRTFANQVFIASVMFGTVVGAGFASGKEIWYYFAKFGDMAYPMIGLAGIMFFLVGYLFLSFGKKFGVVTVQDSNRALFGKFAIIGEMLLIFCNLILLASMFAGANSLFEIVVPGLGYRVASVVTALLALLVAMFGFKSVAKVNVVVVPLLLCVVAVVFFAGLSGGGVIATTGFGGLQNAVESLVFCVLFVSSNMFFAGFIFARLGREANRTEALGGSLIGAILLTLCLLGTTIAIFMNPETMSSDMPLVEIATSLSPGFSYFVLVVVWLGLATTSFALVYTISNWLATYFGSTFMATLTTVAVALLVSGLGFASIVTYLYPVLGLLGLVFIGLAMRARTRLVVPPQAARKLPKKSQID